MRIKLTDIAEVVSGATPSTNHPEYYDGTVVWATPKDLSEQHNKYFTKGERNITEQGFKSCSASMIPADNILMSSRAPIGLLAINTVPCCTNQGFKSLILDHSKCDVDYMYYYLQYHIKEIEALAGGTTFKEVSKASLEKLEIDLPPLSAQKIIGQILSSLDGKILNNNALSSQLESLAKTIYDYWFLQFDFPDENGRPYKSSGGKMVWNEELKREIPEKWSVKRYSDIANTTTGKEDANFATENGKYAYFTCGSNILKCDEYKFDGKAILIAGNGDFNVKYYDGKFNAYQRTYVLMPDERYIGILYQASKRKIEWFKKGSNGSIVKFITKGDIDNIELTIPDDDKLCDPLNSILNFIHHNKIENSKLASLRDFLLPMLMNGQVTFKEGA